MTVRTYAFAGLVLAPASGLALGVWAEFDDLNAPLLLGVATPAIALATLAAARLLRVHPTAVALAGALLGALTLGLSEGVYIAVHRARGGFLNFEAFDSQGEMAAALIAIHAAAGATLGLAVGASLALLLWAGRARGRNRPAARARTIS